MKTIYNQSLLLFSASPKYEEASYKILGSVGLVCEQLGLKQIDLNLICLLPFDEFKDRHKLEERLRKDLKKFYFRGQPIQAKLNQFRCIPEGGGLLMRDTLEVGTAVAIMLGYRNTSLLVAKNGQFAPFLCRTEKHGFADFASQVVAAGSNLSVNQFFEALVPDLSSDSKPPLGYRFRIETKHPVTSMRAENRQRDLDELTELVAKIKQLYWSQIASWLEEELPRQISRVCIGGGTAAFLDRELSEYFGNREMAESKLDWGVQARNQCSEVFSMQSNPLMAVRFTDLSAAFFLFTKATRNAV